MNLDNGMNVDDAHSHRVFILCCSRSLFFIVAFSWLTFVVLKNGGVLARIK